MRGTPKAKLLKLYFIDEIHVAQTALQSQRISEFAANADSRDWCDPFGSSTGTAELSNNLSRWWPALHQ
jgi:hypothetical protein